MNKYSMAGHVEPLHRHLGNSPILDILKAVWEEVCSHNLVSLEVARCNTAYFPLPWELELLARETLVLGKRDEISNQLAEGFDLRAAIRLLRNVGIGISGDWVRSEGDALAALSPLVYQQVTWSADNLSTFVRYIRIFRQPELSQLVEQHIGMTLTQWATLGLAAFALTRDAFEIELHVLTHLHGISPSVLDRFSALMTADIDTVGARLRSSRSTDRDWAFTFNVMRERPLLFQSEKPDTVFAPIPQLIHWRLADGLYYELVKRGGATFAKALGDACEFYIGEILERGLRGSSHKIQKEQKYSVGGQTFAGADWRVSDDTGHVFIECKASRLVLPAKTSIPGTDMDKALDLLAGYVGQNYRNIQDALQGLVPGFERNGLPAFCVVTTLEDWSLHLPQLQTLLQAKVFDDLRRRNLPPALLDECPYFILSFFDLERQVQDIAKSGVANTFLRGPDFRPAEYVGCLFPETLDEAMPGIGFNLPTRDLRSDLHEDKRHDK